MNLSPQFKINLQKVLIITFFYTLINAFMAVYNGVLLGPPFSLGATDLFDFNTHLLLNILIGIIVGLVGGSILVFVNGRYFRRKTFGYALRTWIIAYFLIFVIVVIVNSGLNAIIRLDETANFGDIVAHSIRQVSHYMLLLYFIIWGFITLLTLFLLQVNDKFGPGILVKFIKGNYHFPQEEERIFMFADMRSSTTIAEKIGNKKYFNLLSDLFADITDVILDHEGEIYQYIGDEIVISWPVKKGVKNANCIECFIKIQERLKVLEPFYIKKFGTEIELKAGVHSGPVMAGEIGIIKKDIIYSGDVLNTTSRIQEMCNQYNVDFLLSKQTFDLMKYKEGIKRVPIGSIELRGKKEKIDLSTIEFI